MSIHAAHAAGFTSQGLSGTGTILFNSTDDFFEAVLGPQQHDQHVKLREQQIRMQQQKDWLDAADARLADETARIIASIRAWRAAP